MTLATPSRARPRMPTWVQPTRLSSAVFAAKMMVFQARRVVQDVGAGAPRAALTDDPVFTEIVAESRTPLWSDEAMAERAFQLGKVQNLRVAARALHGSTLAAGQLFSFWRQVGRPSPPRGYATGRMLQQGCMTPAVGGGLCQLSNALYDVALQAGCQIVERHPHSRIVPGSAAAYGRDATVAWNYVDLRFRSTRALRLTVRLDRHDLVVRVLGRPEDVAAGPGEGGESSTEDAARSCGTCDETDCFLHEHDDRRPAMATAGHVFLVDEAWPEFQAYVHGARRDSDRLGLPLDGARWKAERYAWSNEGFEAAHDAAVEALRRTLALRGAGPQGARRRRAEMDGCERIALSLARRLRPRDTAVTVAQSYLPFLWRAGMLGGREVSVLMTRLPMRMLQDRLDAAAARRPDQPTLADFRAPRWLVEAEAEALANAERIITPHAEIAALFGERAHRLDWAMPPLHAGAPGSRPRRIAFPGPTIARKGAHLVREAALALDLEVLLLGADLEGDGFWDGVRILRPDEGAWTQQVAAVVQPALVEDQPRRLLAALAAGLPVLATPACGLNHPGVRLVPSDDAQALITALRDVLRH